MDAKGHVTAVATGTPKDTNTTYGIATNSTAGLVKPLKHYSGAISAPSATSATTAPSVNNITTTSGRYYAVEIDSAGRMFVNVPWVDTDTNTDTKVTSVGNHYAPTSSTTMSATATSVTSEFVDLSNATQAIITGVNVDAAGHICSVNSKTITSTDTNTDTKVTAVGNHYAPTSSTTMGATSGDNYIRGLYMDAKGHVTAVATGTPKDTDTKYTLPNATTAVTGGVKLVTGDMNGKTHADGQAPSLNHTHSQYQPAGSYASSSHSHAASHITGGTSGYFLKADTNGKGVWTSVTIPSAYSLPLAANGTRGGIQIGYTDTGANIALKLNSEKGYVSLTKNAVVSALGYTPPTADTNTDTKVTSVGNHYAPASSTTMGATSGNNYIRGLYMDAAGHVVDVAIGTPNDSVTTFDGHYSPTSSTTMGATSGNNYIRGIHVDAKGHVTAVATGTPTNTDTKVGTTPTGYTTTTATTGNLTFYLAGSPSSSAATSALFKNPFVYVTKGGEYTTLNTPILSATTIASSALRVNTPNDITFSGVSNITLEAYIEDKLSNIGGSDGNDKVAQALVTSSTNKHYLLGSTASTATTGTTVKNTNAYISGTGTSTVFYAPKLSASTVNATTMTATTAFYQSDERLKDFCGDVEVDFDKLKEIPKKYYTWKSDENKEMQIGTSAQKVLEVYPELVGGSEEEMYSVDYARLSVIALKAIDKLHDENQMLKDIIGKMDKRIADLEEKLK